MIHREFRTTIRGKITKHCHDCCLLTVESERFGTVVLHAKDVAPDAMRWDLVEVTAGSVLRDDDEIFSGTVLDIEEVPERTPEESLKIMREWGHSVGADTWTEEEWQKRNGDE